MYKKFVHCLHSSADGRGDILHERHALNLSRGFELYFAISTK